MRYYPGSAWRDCGRPWKSSVRMTTGPGYGSDWAHYEYKGWILPLHQPKSCTGYTQDIMKWIPLPPCSEHTTLHCVSTSRVEPSGKQSTVRLNNHRHEWTKWGALLDQYPCFPRNINILNLNTQSQTSIILQVNSEKVNLFPSIFIVFKIIWEWCVSNF